MISLRFITESLKDLLSFVETLIPYANIDSLKTCNVGDFIQFMPTGIKVSTKDSKSFKLSVMKRKEIMAFIESKR